MFDPVWLIPIAPLAAAVLIALFGRTLGRHGHWPCLLALAISAAAAGWLLFAGPCAGPVIGYRWLAIGDLSISVQLRVDSLTVVMLSAVTLVSFLVAVFAVGYMRGDRGYPRFFATIALFVFSMTMLVLADNFILLYVFWEAVGLCSYLLIGHWFERPSAAAAARKAFLVNRIGDFGFAIGIFLLWTQLGYSLDYATVFSRAATLDPAIATVICLLLFTGAAGKSAQFPLHVWLPDAMEGPTPVSALIHAATMVTAGVYLVARCTPLFVQAPEAQLLVAGIGGLTAVMAAFIALTQNDLKRVLAYSTTSQLGLMFLALGSAAGNPGLTVFAVTAAIFHLFTHAFFKALLFLGSGSIMHALGNVIDMRRFGGLRRIMPHTHWTFLIGALALAGVVPLAGFWSKDEILAAVFEAARGPFSLRFQFLFAAALLTTFLTAFYTFRAYFKTFWGEERIPAEAGHHPHESPMVMRIPLFVLALGALAVGAVLGPTHVFGRFLAETPDLKKLAGPEHGLNFMVMGLSLLLAVGGAGLAWLMYAWNPDLPGIVQTRLRAGYQLSVNKLYLDEIYQIAIVGPLKLVALICRGIDALIDGLVDLVGRIPSFLGAAFRPVQNGLVQFYAVAMLLGVGVFLIAVLVRLGW